MFKDHHTGPQKALFGAEAPVPEVFSPLARPTPGRRLCLHTLHLDLRRCCVGSLLEIKRRFSDHPMELIDNVVAELKAVGEKHGGKLPSQVALNWIIAKGAIPIPGAKNRQQAQENAGALGWSLDGDDLERLDSAALGGVRSFQSRIWQHG